jgi:hypothetical protein
MGTLAVTSLSKTISVTMTSVEEDHVQLTSVE